MKKAIKKSAKLTAAKVQPFFNAMIREAGGRCVTCGKRAELQASHFFEVGGSGALRFYPPNVHAQCGGCHLDYHNRTGLPYTRWMQNNVEELDWMERARKVTIRYKQADLEQIKAWAKAGFSDHIKRWVEEKIRAEIQ